MPPRPTVWARGHFFGWSGESTVPTMWHFFPGNAFVFLCFNWKSVMFCDEVNKVNTVGAYGWSVGIRYGKAAYI